MTTLIGPDDPDNNNNSSSPSWTWSVPDDDPNLMVMYVPGPDGGLIPVHVDQQNYSRTIAAIAGEQEIRRLYQQWFDEVLQPLGVDHDLGFELYCGDISTDEFANRLGDATAERFEDQFERLQTRFLTNHPELG